MKLMPLTPESYETMIPFYETFRIEGSELNFTNLFMWRHKYGFHYIILENYLWICNIKNSSTYYFSQPLGDYEDLSNLSRSIKALRLLLSDMKIPFIIKKADLRFVNVLNKLDLYPQIKEDRDAFDYIYDFSEMSSLVGNKYHKKKNHINKFIKSVPDYRFIPLDQTSLPLLKENFYSWFDDNQREGFETDYDDEKHAIQEALDHYDLLDFSGGIVEVDGKVEAYTLGEALNNDTLLIHIEKANNNIPGLYTFINQQFLLSQNKSFSWVNREQDLGIEGLRKAKLSYHPAFFIEKFIIHFNV